MRDMDELRSGMKCDLFDHMHGANAVTDENLIKLSWAAERILTELLLAGYLASEGGTPSRRDKAGAMIVIMRAAEAFGNQLDGLKFAAWPDYASFIDYAADSVIRHNESYGDFASCQVS